MNEKLRKILGTIIGIIFFVCIALFMTYALYRWQSDETSVNVTIVDGSFEFTSDTLDVDVEGLGPVLDYNSSENIANKNVVYSDFSANNVSSNVYYMNVKLNIISITSNLLDESFKYVLLKKDTSTNKYSIVASEGDFTEFGVGYNNIVNNYTISKSPGDSFRFIVYIDGNQYNNQNLMNGVMKAHLVLEADSAVLGEGNNAASYIQNLYSDGSTLTTANIGGDTTNPSVSLNADQGLMLDNNGDYRYYGASPNNYVWFNDELWRIISVGNVKSSESDTTGETRVKIIKADIMTDDNSNTTFSWDSSLAEINQGYGVNDWTQADLMDELNDGYYNSGSIQCYIGGINSSTPCNFTNSGLDVNARNLISDALYYLGGNSSESIYADDYYNFERGTDVWGSSSDETCNDGACPRATTWSGKVGVMYPSDYLYATDLSVCTSYGDYYDNTGCYNNDWLYSSNEQWTITSYSNDAFETYLINNSGYVMPYFASEIYAIRPVVYLKSNVDIVSGSGTQSDPYRLQNPATTAGSYTVSYDANGGSGVADLQRKVDGEAVTISSVEPVRAGYTFLGWATTQDATTATYQAGDTYTADASVTLYAVWRYNGDVALNSVDAGSYVLLNISNKDVMFRLAYVEDEVPYLISDGVVTQMCTNNDGSYNTTLDGGCDQTWDTSLPPTHSTNLEYVVSRALLELSFLDMVENYRSVNLDDFYKITGLSGESCFGVNTADTCGKGNDLIDIGTNYWFSDYVDDEDYGGYASVAWLDGYYINKYRIVDMLGYDPYGVRPVLQMKTGVMVTSGTGTEGDPYVLSYSSEVEEPETYTVSYDANGGSGAPESQTKTEAVNLTLSSTVPTRDGYTFLGWSTDSEATTATYQAGGTYSNDSSATLYAVWDPDEYTVSYDANGGSGAPESQTKTHGVNLTLSSTVPTRDGYTFLGWSTDSEATTATYQAGGTYSNDSSATLYAKWTDSEVPSASISTTSTLKATSQTATLTCSDNVGVVSYYWGTSSPTSSSTYTSITSNTSMSVTKTVSSAGTYYLACKDAAGNTSTTTSQVYYSYVVNNMLDTSTGTQGVYTTNNYSQNSTYTYLAPNDTKITFSSVYTAPTGSTFKAASVGAASTTAPSTTYTTYVNLAGNRTYSMWFNRNLYTISYNANGGSGAPSSQTKKYGVNLTLSSTVPTKDGYAFLGWSTSSTSTTATYQAGGTYSTNETVILYAVWKDAVAPSVPTYVASYADGSGSYTSGTWTDNQVNTVISSTDNESGVSYMQYSEDQSTWNNLNFAAGSMTQSGTTWTGTEGWTVRERNQTYYFRACDSADNCSGSSEAFNIRYDITAPTAPTYSAYYANGSGSYTSGNTASSQVYTDISSTDVGSGVSYIQYSKDQSSWTTFSFSVSALTQNGTIWTGTEPWNYTTRNDTYYFRACDNMGLCSGSSAAFNIVYNLSCTTYTQVKGTTSTSLTLVGDYETNKCGNDVSAALLSTSYTFSSSTGKYTLSGSTAQFTTSLSLSTYKYTCGNSSTTSCSTLYVINSSAMSFSEDACDGYDYATGYYANAYKYTSSCS